MLVLAEPLRKLLSAAAQLPQGPVQVQIAVGGVKDTPGDVGAVVGGALQVGKQVGPGKARVDGALAPLQAEDVTGAQLFLEPASGPSRQSLAHDAHAEQAQAAGRRQHVE